MLEGTSDQRIQHAVEAIRAGRMVILTDDEDRENEGDLVMAADLVTPEAINFMAREARGLICLTLTEEVLERLRLPMMVEKNRASLGTAFTVSIEAREGVTTGISAADRAHTIKVAVDPATQPEDLVSPGHVFPLLVRPGGVLQRTGQTEGSADLARIAGHAPAGVICEIMNDDGTMARMPDLVAFGRKHDMPILTIEDLIQHRLRTDRLVRRAHSTRFRPMGMRFEWTAHVYGTSIDPNRQFLALSLGEVEPEVPTLVRMHPGAVFADLFGPSHTADGTPTVGGGRYLVESMQRMEDEGRGVVVYVPPTRIDLLAELKEQTGDGKARTHDLTRNGSPAQREHGLGAQVLMDLGLRKIRLMTNNPRRMVGLSAYGIEVCEQVALGTPTEPVSRGIAARA